ncbi:hypothetical protein SADUNF_Sadunf19G0000200 [Salix dunnii]|uniref:Uncharacterized protein n=1 Tax=Salix dunnii TaxID=1413687 RepID=A0A835J2F0_9ROSI|nr:hypothetical protein SADUNF_Sadunf19G0000200 [Salix dunnii]
MGVYKSDQNSHDAIRLNPSVCQWMRTFPQEDDEWLPERMEGVPLSSMEDDFNFTSNQFGFQASEDNFNMFESPPEEVPVSQSSILWNDQAGQSRLVDNNDSIQQTTHFPQTMVTTPICYKTTLGGLDGTSSSFINQNRPNWPQTPSSLKRYQMLSGLTANNCIKKLPTNVVNSNSDQQWTNQLLASNQVPGRLPQPPMNQCPYDPQSSTMLPESSQSLRFLQFPPHNLQVSRDHNQGQEDQTSLIPCIDNLQQENLVPRNISKSTRSQMENLQVVHVLLNQTARPNASNPSPDSSLQSQNRGLNTQQVRSLTELSPIANCLFFPPSSMDDDVNHLDVDRLMSELLLSPAEEVLVKQSSMLCNDRAGQNMLVNINDTIRQTTRFPPSFPQTMVTTHALFISSAEIMGVWSPLDEVPVNQSSILCNDQGGQNMLVDNNDSTLQTTQFPPQNHQVSGDHVLLNSNCYDSTFFEPTSSSRQPQQGHVNMTPNTTTSQHGGFNQPRPSVPAPRIQCIPNQGQVASVFPHMDNMQQENLVPRNIGKSTRSQMENLQVHVLQNQTTRPNASNLGPDSSLQSQNRGLNTQKVRSLTELSSCFYPL